ncbi:hypothetical protein BSKO_05705 [Bryopsis sp. KO-2023]|nr:hypothetical protein BSKO_05705 [Bryopsis sp. KO-2023]
MLAPVKNDVAFRLASRPTHFCQRTPALQRSTNYVASLREMRSSSRSNSVRSRGQMVVRAESRGGFTSGFVVGGLICGVLGFLYAPQISRALLDEQERMKLPFMADEPPQPRTKDDLVARVDELNAAVDELSASINTTVKDVTEQTA